MALAPSLMELMTSAPGSVLGLFAKQPLAGHVKTRLAAESSPEWAAQVAEACLLDTLAKFEAIPARRVLAYAPADAEVYFARLVQERFTLVPQIDGDLGQRMAAFFQQQVAGGSLATVLLGADSPTLPTAWIAQAFTELERADIVLGPTTDGGYYLIGCGRQLPPVFEGIRWGSVHVLSDTMARLTDSSWRLALLPPWYDIDTLA